MRTAQRSTGTRNLTCLRPMLTLDVARFELFLFAPFHSEWRTCILHQAFTRSETGRLYELIAVLCVPCAIAGGWRHQLIPFLESIASAPDVRPLVRAEFKLHERVAASS